MRDHIMARLLPFTAVTDTGDKFDIEFPLHASTDSPIRVHQLLGDILGTVSREVRRDTMSNGDVLQALTMAIAIRARMIAADPTVTAQLAEDLLTNALQGVSDANTSALPSGQA
jgi:hypothetical protein